MHMLMCTFNQTGVICLSNGCIFSLAIISNQFLSQEIECKNNFLNNDIQWQTKPSTECKHPQFGDLSN